MRLDPGKTWTINLPKNTEIGSVWARTGCSFDGEGNGSCQTGDCDGVLACERIGQPPITLAEFSLNQFESNSFFDISLSKGFNVPMEFLPMPVKGHGGARCTRGPHCTADITSQCPSELKRIAHLDVKPQNILLDSDFNAKRSDFGLCKLIDRDMSRVVTRMRGTPGYLAPEWLTSQITEKADVYSFGVVVMEIISGRKNLDTSRSEESLHLITLLEEKVKNSQLVDLIDKKSNDMQAHEQDAIQMMKLAMWCLQIDCKRRPKMSEVVKVLEGIMDAESNIDHNFVATNETHFGIAGNVNSSPPAVASDVSGPR
uniref:Uncharacterized protein n=1 Tax=Avena sativa TaxID=4498 RepID=A0ACD5VE53_AVESA